MSAFAEHASIQRFKEGFVVGDDNLNYARVVAPFLYDGSLKGWLKKLVFSLFFSTHITWRVRRGGGILIYYSCRQKQRADYDYIPERLHHLLAEQADYAETDERASVRQLFMTLRELPCAWGMAKSYRAGLMQRLGCALLIAKYRSTARHVVQENIVGGYKKVVTFCDAQPPENLFAQIASAAGAMTFTNQHGQYRILDERNMSPDAEAYANFVSDRIFCWGEATCREFQRAGFDPDRLVVTGWIRPSVEGLSPSEVKGTFGVMLNGENGRDSNVALLRASQYVAKALGMRYLVRMHPWSRTKTYEPLLDENCAEIGHYGLENYLGKVEFSMAHMTGATIEMLDMGRWVYLLDDGLLAEVFQLEGLSYGSADAIAAAVHEDVTQPEAAMQRIARLARWYNDNSEQDSRIMGLLLD